MGRGWAWAKMAWAGAGLSAGLWMMSVSGTAEAYTEGLSEQGRPLRWMGRPRLDLAGYPVNRSGIGSDYLFSTVVRSLQLWQDASLGQVEFDYWQGTNPKIFEPNSDFNGLSSLYFSSSGGQALGPSVLGMTQVWYAVDTGEILEADVQLNDVDFRFSTNESDTSSQGSRSVYLANVVAHELGHAYGLSHSGVAQASMFPIEASGQSEPTCDDQAGIRSLAIGPRGASRGEVSGRILSESSGSPVFGAHVVAVSRTLGRVEGSAVTNPSGEFRIGGLDPGEVLLLAEPYFLGGGSLPAPYQGIQPRICPAGNYFSRTWWMNPSGAAEPLAIGIPSGGAARAPDLVVRCSGNSDFSAAIAAIPGTSSLMNAPRLEWRSDQSLAFVDRIDSGATYYRLGFLSGALEMRTTAIAVFSQASTRLKLLDSRGRWITAATSEVSESGDARLRADSLPMDEYVLKIEKYSASGSDYPTGGMGVDQVPFLLVTGRWGGTLNLGRSVGTRCSLPTPERVYQSPAGDPRRHSMERETGIGFCGSIRRAGDGNWKGGLRSSDGPSIGPSSPDRFESEWAKAVRFFLPFSVVAVAWRWQRRRRLPAH